MNRNAVTLVEVVIGLFLLALLAVPLWDLLSVERREISWSSNEVALHAYAADRLAAEAARLREHGFAATQLQARPLDPPLVPGATESVSVEPTEQTSGLWKLAVEIAWRPAGQGPRQLRLSRLVADRVPAFSRPLVDDHERGHTP